ncbi:hypothetical protein [Bacillus cereus]|uniref:hypothetical protein n=1 Tax=Bacillus cereus TaxID=1396 RepID=UPI000BEC377C|nr:hypothetical protein [Bacillus cereus]MDF9654239.1 hypothetical protein [Bacillus cereus]PEE60885.1 hypothetical protein COM68_03955 [Bacillus cereus]PFB16339.1 hypothetical protein CN408_23475 [Bacillus cereus]PFC61780.1 hypothetical protein CN267_12015 [Bacillus cereus]PFD05334.1 hypothetical protein CN277_06005 [Bacillus cereus]
MTNSKEVTETVETQHTWQDHLFPDNPKRRKRVEQLMNECTDYASKLADNKIRIDGILESINKRTKEAYRLIGVESISYKEIKLDQEWYVKMLQPIGISAVFGLTNKGLRLVAKKIAVSFLLKQGKIGPAALVKLVGFPKWFKFGTTVGSAIGGAIVAVGIDVAIDAITGNDERDKLQNAIKDLAKPRIELQYGVLKIEYYYNLLLSIAREMNSIQRKASKNKWTEAVLDENIQEAIADTIEIFKETTPEPTRETTLIHLNEKDKLLGNWINEDFPQNKLAEIIKELNEQEKNIDLDAIKH